MKPGFKDRQHLLYMVFGIFQPTLIGQTIGIIGNMFRIFCNSPSEYLYSVLIELSTAKTTRSLHLFVGTEASQCWLVTSHLGEKYIFAIRSMTCCTQREGLRRGCVGTKNKVPITQLHWMNTQNKVPITEQHQMNNSPSASTSKLHLTFNSAAAMFWKRTSCSISLAHLICSAILNVDSTYNTNHDFP